MLNGLLAYHGQPRVLPSTSKLPAARAAAIPETSRIFPSATAQDCREYRKSVRDFVQANEPAVPISPQEDRVAGGEFVYEVCEERVEDLSTRTDRRVANHVS